MTKISIKRRNESPRRDGTAALYAVINIGRDKVRLPLDLAVTNDEWDAGRECIRGKSQQAIDRNLVIKDTIARVSDILIKARLSGQTLTKERFLAIYRQPGATTEFAVFARRRLDELRSAMQFETLRHHQIAIKKVENYAPALQLGDITPEWLRVYAAHLRDFHHNNPGTIAKNLSVIRMHYYAAMRSGLVNTNPFEVYKMPISEPAIIYLTEKELGSLIRLFHSNTLSDVKQDTLRFFLFMAFTAMHISDARNLQIEQIFAGEIHYRRVKTRTRVEMPLSAPARKLVEFYSDGRKRGPLFLKLPTDQAFNRYIKIICAQVGIHKAVSAKAARHTFATLYYAKNPGDLGTLSKLLGHTSVNTTMIYAHIMKDTRISGVSVFDDML